MVFSSLSRVISSGFFAIGKNWHIVFCTIFFVCFHAFFAKLLTSAYGLKGLVASTALSSVFHFVLLIGFLFYLMGRVSLKSTFVMLLRNLPGLFLLGLCLKLYPYLYSLFPLFFVLFLGGGVYILSAYFLKDETSLEFVDLLRQFFRKRNA